MAAVDRILIVGGGIGGLALAAALHMRGFRPELVERYPEWRTSGTGIGVLANAMRVLRTLEIDRDVLEGGEVLRHWSYVDARGELLSSSDLEKMWEGVGPCVGIARGTLHEALLTGAASIPARLGISPVGLIQHDDEVRVDFSDGTHADYDLVVGADGIHSTVRNLLFGGPKPGYAGQVVWRSVVPARPAGVDGMVVVLGEGCFFGLAPIGGGRTYGFGGLDAPEAFADPIACRLERFRRRFAELGGPVPEYLSALETDDQLRYDAIERVDLDQWHSGRVLLIGDAAHASPPHMGQGGGMAMEDAVVLSELLDEEGTVERALDAFTKRRRPRVDWVQQQSQAALAAWLLPTSVRDAALRERGDEIMQIRFAPLRAEP